MTLPDLPPEPLDPSALQQIVELGEGDLSLLHEMIGIFRDDTPPRLEALRVALEAEDAATMAAEAHAIKGAAGTMGAQRIRLLAMTLEHAGRQGSADMEEKILFELLQAAFQEALEAMDAYAANLVRS